MSNSRKGTWSKIFHGCAKVTTALDCQLDVPVAQIRKLLVSAGLTNNEISTVFDYLRNHRVVTVENNIWNLNGRDFNLR